MKALTKNLNIFSILGIILFTLGFTIFLACFPGSYGWIYNERCRLDEWHLFTIILIIITLSLGLLGIGKWYG